MMANHVLIWASRHVKTFGGYIAQDQKQDFKEVVEAVNKSDNPGSQVNVPRTALQHHAFDTVQRYCHHLQEAASWREQGLALRQHRLETTVKETETSSCFASFIKDSPETPSLAPSQSLSSSLLVTSTPVSPAPPDKKSLWDHSKEYHNKAAQAAQEILEQWGDTAPFVHQMGIARDTLEVQAGLRDRPLSDAQIALQPMITAYLSTVKRVKRIVKR